jgi:hypothetical protein
LPHVLHLLLSARLSSSSPRERRSEREPHSLPRAVEALNDMANPRFVQADKCITLRLLQNAKGLAFITVY